MLRWLAVVTILLQGCAAAPLVVTGLGVTGVVVNETTGKTATDHVVSAVNGKDCRVSRMTKGDICQDQYPEANFQIVTTKVTPSTVEEIESKYR